MQKQYDEVVADRQATASMVVEREKTFAKDYVLRKEAVKEREVEVAKFREEWMQQQKLEIDLQISTCRELCKQENEVPLENQREEMNCWISKYEDLSTAKVRLKRAARTHDSEGPAPALAAGAVSLKRAAPFVHT